MNKWISHIQLRHRYSKLDAFVKTNSQIVSLGPSLNMGGSVDGTSAGLQSPVSNSEKNNRIRKRPRPILSCLSCRRKKLKCDRNFPCGQCSKAGRNSNCTFANEDRSNGESRKGNHEASQGTEDAEPNETALGEKTKCSKKHGAHDQGTLVASPSSISASQHGIPSTGVTGGVLEDIQARLGSLERLLGRTGAQISSVNGTPNAVNGTETRDEQSLGHTAFGKIRDGQSKCDGQTAKVDMSPQVRTRVTT
jgi:hypothetical protein